MVITIAKKKKTIFSVNRVYINPIGHNKDPTKLPQRLILSPIVFESFFFDALI